MADLVSTAARGTQVLSSGDRRLVVLAVALTAGSAATHATHASTVVGVAVSVCALASLAALVGRSIDRLGDRLGSGATGVVQSALGNLPELFIAIFALRAGLVGVVQAALVGSVLANVLLVLGAAFVAGGARHGTQHFGTDAPRTSVLLLLLAVSIVTIPTLTAHLGGATARHEHALSDVASVVLLLLYALSLPMALRAASAREHASVATGGPDGGGQAGELWPVWVVVAMLVASSAAAAFVSDWFVTALTPALGELHVSQAFAGLVVVAIAGNAVENVVGISLAAKDRMDYALSIVLQSPVQITLLLLPALVLLSGTIGGASLTLVMPVTLVAALGLGTAVTVVVVFDGESTWLEGAALIGLYVTIAASFWWG